MSMISRVCLRKATVITSIIRAEEKYFSDGSKPLRRRDLIEVIVLCKNTEEGGHYLVYKR